MTYCLGMLLAEGLVMMADTRTNAGIDNISSYKKLHTLHRDEERVVFACTSGNLSVTQLAFQYLAEGMPAEEEGGETRTIATMANMHRIAGLVGEAIHCAREEIKETTGESQYDFAASVLVGGRFAGRPLRLFHIYSVGNFISCQPDRPFLQIGETKYGKPILDRSLHYDMSLDDAVKTGLISFDSTMRSNLGVGRPIDMVVVPADEARPIVERRIGEEDGYFNMLSREWARALAEAREAIAMPPYLREEPKAEPEAAAAPGRPSFFRPRRAMKFRLRG